MTSKKTNTPEVIEDQALENAAGGLPAVQKVREAGARMSTTQTAPSQSSSGLSAGKVSMSDLSGF